MLTLEFRLKARPRDPICESLGDFKDWLYLMQHHGFPTRLLDWSDSYLVAAFFACCEEDLWNSDGAIWGIHPFALNSHQVDDFVICGESVRETAILFQGPFVENAPALERIVALNTTHATQRMMCQHSRFTIHGTANRLNALPDADTFVFKLCIPSGSKTCIQRELLRMGIRLSTLFPDLEHLAKDIVAHPYVKRVVPGSSA